MSRRPEITDGVVGEPPAELEVLLAELAAAGSAAAAEHVEPARLLAYHAGGLSEEQEGLVRAHLVDCPACSAILLDLETFRDAATEGRGPAAGDFGTATAWRAFAPRLAPPKRELSKGADRGSLPWLIAIAASLLAAALGLLWLQSTQRNRELRLALVTPQVGVPMLYLDSSPRDEGELARLELPAVDGIFLLAVTPNLPASATGHRVEIFDAESRSVWRGDELALSDHGTLRLGFTPRTLPPGRYRLEVRVAEDSRPVNVFPFVLEAPH